MQSVLRVTIKQIMPFMRTVCPWNDLMGLSMPSLHTWIFWSVLQLAKDVLVCQSTSSAGAEWKENCCVHSAVAASQMMVVLSTFLWGDTQLYFMYLDRLSQNSTIYSWNGDRGCHYGLEKKGGFNKK